MRKSKILLFAIISLIALAITFEIYNNINQTSDKNEYPVDSSNVTTIRLDIQSNINSKLMEHTFVLYTDGNVKILEGVNLNKHQRNEKLNKHQIYSTFNIYDVDTMYYKESYEYKKIPQIPTDNLDEAETIPFYRLDSTLTRKIIIHGQLIEHGQNVNSINLRVTGKENAEQAILFLKDDFKNLIRNWTNWYEKNANKD